MTDDSLIRRDQLPLRTAFAAPRGPTEAKLAEIWAAVLGMDRVGIDDRYHDLGGDSLHAAIMFAKLHETFGVELPLASLEEAATIAQLALLIARHAPPGRSVPP